MEARFRHGHAELLVLAHREDGARRLLRVPLGGGAPVPVLEREVTAFAASPDGSAVATADGGGRLALLTFDGGAERVLGKLEPGEQPIGWTVDGRGLLLVDPGALRCA